MKYKVKFTVQFFRRIGQFFYLEVQKPKTHTIAVGRMVKACTKAVVKYKAANPTKVNPQKLYHKNSGLAT